MLAAPMARLLKKCRRQEPQVQPRSPGPPCAMVLRLLRVLPGAPGFLATVVRVMQNTTTNLTSASGCQDRATWPCVPVLFVRAEQAPRANRHAHRIPPQRSWRPRYAPLAV